MGEKEGGKEGGREGGRETNCLGLLSLLQLFMSSHINLTELVARGVVKQNELTILTCVVADHISHSWSYGTIGMTTSAVEQYPRNTTSIFSCWDSITHGMMQYFHLPLSRVGS